MVIDKLIRKIRGARKSLVIWFNTIVGTAVTLLPVAQESFPQLQEYLPANIYQWVMGALVVGNIILRFRTTLDLAHK